MTQQNDAVSSGRSAFGAEAGGNGDKVQALEHDIAASYGNCFDFRGSSGEVAPPMDGGDISPPRAQPYRKLACFYFTDVKGNTRNLDDLPHGTNRLYAYGQLVRPGGAEAIVRENGHVPDRLHVRLLVRRWSVGRACVGRQASPHRPHAAGSDGDGSADGASDGSRGAGVRTESFSGGDDDDDGVSDKDGAGGSSSGEHGAPCTVPDVWIETVPVPTRGAPGWWYLLAEPPHQLYKEHYQQMRVHAEHVLAAAHGRGHVDVRNSGAAAGGGAGSSGSGGGGGRDGESCNGAGVSGFDGGDDGDDGDADSMSVDVDDGPGDGGGGVSGDSGVGGGAGVGGGRGHVPGRSLNVRCHGGLGSGSIENDNDDRDDRDERDERDRETDTCSCDAARGSTGSDQEENGSEADAESMGGDSLSLASVDSRSESGGGNGDGDGTDIEVQSTTSAASFTSASSCGGACTGLCGGELAHQRRGSGGSGGSGGNGGGRGHGPGGGGGGSSGGGGSFGRSGRGLTPEPDARALQIIAEMQALAGGAGAGVPLTRMDDFVRRFLRRDLRVAARAAAVVALSGSGDTALTHLVQVGGFLVLHAWLRESWARLRVHKQPRRGVAPDWAAVGGLPYLENMLLLMSRLPLSMSLLRSTEVGRLVKKLRRLAERHKTDGLQAAARRLYAHFRDIVATNMRRQGCYPYDNDGGNSGGRRGGNGGNGGGTISWDEREDTMLHGFHYSEGNSGSGCVDGGMHRGHARRGFSISGPGAGAYGAGGYGGYGGGVWARYGTLHDGGSDRGGRGDMWDQAIGQPEPIHGATGGWDPGEHWRWRDGGGGGSSAGGSSVGGSSVGGGSSCGGSVGGSVG
ncbi:unnamed protein product, partial [Phaeothamnion confervicola]